MGGDESFCPCPSTREAVPAWDLIPMSLLLPAGKGRLMGTGIPGSRRSVGGGRVHFLPPPGKLLFLPMGTIIPECRVSRLEVEWRRKKMPRLHLMSGGGKVFAPSNLSRGQSGLCWIRSNVSWQMALPLDPSVPPHPDPILGLGVSESTTILIRALSSVHISY